ncbi:response regulator transcription factor [Tellurirhabdus rosea]|uniref:response regulator transcription factor n=1 Tax=Tellurirhabdus rosea TaxID=2674997 RepID=UPI00224F5DF7|nr:response regulator transcription factor [Tellurirhabdus rosea]
MKDQYHILLVDDDTFIRKVLRQTLKEDFIITTQANGMEAMAWLEQGNEPNLIITDLQMPHLDGQELIRLLRSSSLLRQIPIMVLSVHDDSQTRIRCLELGADDFITKPFNPLEVRAKINAILRRVNSHYSF